MSSSKTDLRATDNRGVSMNARVFMVVIRLNNGNRQGFASLASLLLPVVGNSHLDCGMK